MVVSPVGRGKEEGSKLEPQEIVGVPEPAVITNHKVCPIVGVPDKLVVIDVILLV